MSESRKLSAFEFFHVESHHVETNTHHNYDPLNSSGNVDNSLPVPSMSSRTKSDSNINGRFTAPLHSPTAFELLEENRHKKTGKIKYLITL